MKPKNEKSPKPSESTPSGKSAEKSDAQPVRKLRVYADPCPKSPNHKNTRVYRTVGQTRYCVCDDCGHTWKQIGEPATAEAGA